MLKVFGAVALVGAVYAQNSSLPTVDLGYEIYRAAGFNSTGNFYNFSNIRYAQPPVGNLRFALPVAPLQSRDAVNNGDMSRICPQAGPAWGQVATNAVTALLTGQALPNQTYVPPGAYPNSTVPPPTDPRESEDCLFLDVFVPQDVLGQAGKSNYSGAPVLVWIYGGGYNNGDKNNNPAGLLAASGTVSHGEVIYVTLNYRLGAFGWQSGPSYQAEGGVSNLGLYDQRFALEWVQKKIHLFGGDKNKVTVFGESAGGGSIMHQITAYGGSRGKAPFQQAIPQSPGWRPMQSSLQQEDIYQKFLQLTNATCLAELRALPYETLRRANFQQVTYDPGYGSFVYGVTVDGNFVPQQPGQLLAQGRFDKDIRIMVGHNAHEGTYFTPPTTQTDADVEAEMREAFPYAPQKSIDYVTQTLYPPVFNGSYGYLNNYQRAQLITSESVFTCNTNFLASAFRNASYSYLFSVPPAFHAFDVVYTYWTGGPPTNNPLGVMNTTVANALQHYITSFAKNGVPDSDGIPKFIMYGENATVLDLGVTGFVNIQDSDANGRCAWWQKALY